MLIYISTRTPFRYEDFVPPSWGGRCEHTFKSTNNKWVSVLSDNHAGPSEDDFRRAEEALQNSR